MDLRTVKDLVQKLNPTIDEAKIEELYNKYAIQYPEEETWGLRDLLRELRFAITVERHWSPEEVLEQVKEILLKTRVDKEEISFDEVSKRWRLRAYIGETEINFEGTEWDLFNFIEEINEGISQEVGAYLEPIDTGTDTSFFILVPKHISLDATEIEVLEGEY